MRACELKMTEETARGRSEASNVGPADRSVSARSLFLREGRTKSLWPKCLWPPKRRRARGARHAQAERPRAGAAQDERRCHSGLQTVSCELT